MGQVKICPVCQHQWPLDQQRCHYCGHMFSTVFGPALNATQVFSPPPVYPPVNPHAPVVQPVTHKDTEWKIKAFWTWFGTFVFASGAMNLIRTMEDSAAWVIALTVVAIGLSFLAICLMRLYRNVDRSGFAVTLTLVLCLSLLSVVGVVIDENRTQARLSQDLPWPER